MLRVVALAIVLTFASTSAWAWETVSGVVITVDMLARTVTLENGRTFKLPQDVSVTDLHSGDKIVINIGSKPGDVVSVAKA